MAFTFFFPDEGQTLSKAEMIYKRLMDEFRFKHSTGSIRFSLKTIEIVVNQNNVVGNILEEWIAKWMTENKIPHIHNSRQSSPDFWLDKDDFQRDWLEVKSFTGSPNFDIANFNSFINLIVDEPCKLQSDYLLIKYRSEHGIVTIEDCWLKKVWEISCPSERWPVKVQDKKGMIYNIRPAVWYSDSTDYPAFRCMEDFLSALEELIYVYPETHHLGAKWQKKLVESYEKQYGVKLHIPRWMDIADSYQKRRK